MTQSIYKKTKEVYNILGEKYLKDSQKLTPPERLPFAKLLPKGGSILDVGCGGGRDAEFFAKRGLKVIGTDVSDVLINLAQKNVPQATFMCEDILKSKFPKNSFEGIWAHAILLHLKRNDVPKALKKFHTILKSGGMLHVRVKKGKGEEFVKEKLSAWNERFYTYFTKKEMEDMFKKEGFKVIASQITPDELHRPGVSWIMVWGQKQ